VPENRRFPAALNFSRSWTKRDNSFFFRIVFPLCSLNPLPQFSPFPTHKGKRVRFQGGKLSEVPFVPRFSTAPSHFFSFAHLLTFLPLSPPSPFSLRSKGGGSVVARGRALLKPVPFDRQGVFMPLGFGAQPLTTPGVLWEGPLLRGFRFPGEGGLLLGSPLIPSRKFPHRKRS